MDRELFDRLVARYLWWKTPEEALSTVDRLLAQVMDIGDFDDVQAVVEAVGEDRLREVLRKAEAGQFRPKSWHYWHYRLGLARVEARGAAIW